MSERISRQLAFSIIGTEEDVDEVEVAMWKALRRAARKRGVQVTGNNAHEDLPDILDANRDGAA